jgi:hypothetical protein
MVLDRSIKANGFSHIVALRGISTPLGWKEAFEISQANIISNIKDSVIIRLSAVGAGHRVAHLLKTDVGSFVLYFPETTCIHPSDRKETKEKPGQPTVRGLEWCSGAEHQYAGKVKTGGYTFVSDPNYPLIFKVTKGKDYVYLCGCGIVKRQDGKEWKLGMGHRIGIVYLIRLHTENYHEI